MRLQSGVLQTGPCSASPAALGGVLPLGALGFGARARVGHRVRVQLLAAVGAGQLHLLLAGGGFTTTLALVHHAVGFRGISAGTQAARSRQVTDVKSLVSYG